MPAYRSPAEADIRDAVVARLRALRPEARIIHEIQCAVYGPNRIDLIAVSKAEIIAVEVKSAKDKLDRLSAQIASMRLMAHHVIAAIHEKFLVEQSTNEWAAHYVTDGKFFKRAVPADADGAVAWVFPERPRLISQDNAYGYDNIAKWESPSPTLCRAVPTGALDMLWAEELRHVCNRLSISIGKRATRDECLTAVRWYAKGSEITKEVCRTLRQRRCTEADEPIDDVNWASVSDSMKLQSISERPWRHEE